MSGTEAILRHALLQNMAITLVVNKIDRLILELRIPPADAYYKVKATIEEVNTYIRCEPNGIFCNTLKYSLPFDIVVSTLTLNCD